LSPNALQRAAAALGRARRLVLLGAPPPFLGRLSTHRPAGAELEEHGITAVRVAAIWGRFEAIDAAVADLTESCVAFGEEALTPSEALRQLVDEPEAEERTLLAEAITTALSARALKLAGAWALAADDSAALGAVELVSARTVDCARRVLSAGDDAVRDVLGWATRRLGRPQRAPLAAHDVARLMRNPELDGLFVGRDPWETLREWRVPWEAAGRTAQAPEQASEPRFEIGTRGLGAWALSGRRQSRVGVSAWPHALQHRFALVALGLWDTLRASGWASMLPLDEGAASLANALWPPLLAERPYLARVLQAADADPDTLRLLALGEAVCDRLAAGAALVVDEFQRSRSVAQAVAASETHFRRAIFAPLRSELGLLFCSPFGASSGGSGISAPPDAVLAARQLAQSLRRDHDADWWRNPRAFVPLRDLWARGASDSLETLVTGFDPAAGEAALREWFDEKLGG
jgi:hypothetical protein